jgi:tetraacyldisaccharide 4'-kinase
MKSDLKSLLSALYAPLTEGKNFLYDSGLLDSVNLRVPVLSVGNLSMGGTGKTPVVQQILLMALEKKIRVSVVARNYQARSRGIHKVDSQRPDAAAFYGDEACLVATLFPQVGVWTGPQKYLTAQETAFQDNCQLILVDDGFQHRALHRDFDLVLVDCSAQSSEESLIPAGRFREGLASLKRAQMVALTKVNWADPLQVERWKSRIPAGVETCEIEFHTTSLQPIPDSARILAVCGIAKPESFSRTVRELGPLELVDTLVFGDHFDYGPRDVHRILERFRRFDCHQILTTEKDFVKLSQYPELTQFINPVRVQTRFRQEPQGLNAFLDQVAGA